MRFLPALLSLFLLCSCQTAAPTRFSLSQAGITGKLLSPGDWLGQDLDFAPYDDLRTQLEKELGKPLKNRGEAHITVITPPEMKILTRTMTAADIARLATTVNLAESKFEAICVGRAQKDGLETYFVVVQSPRLINFRKNVAMIARNPKEFKPDEYYPHITLGFTERDLHLQDGVLKNEKTCRNSIAR